MIRQIHPAYATMTLTTAIDAEVMFGVGSTVAREVHGLLHPPTTEERAERARAISGLAAFLEAQEDAGR